MKSKKPEASKKGILGISPLALYVVACLIIICGSFVAQAARSAEKTQGMQSKEIKKVETAIFAGGCFWCLEPSFDKLQGVAETTVGYTGGSVVNPTYEQVSAGNTGHKEAIAVAYDPAKISYEKLVQTFFENIDPTDAGGQFADRGPQYETAVFVESAEQRQIAEKIKAEMQQKLGKPIVTEILPATAFYAAEDYHQEYYEKNPLRYNLYKNGSGRPGKLEQLWGKQAK